MSASRWISSAVTCLQPLGIAIAQILWYYAENLEEVAFSDTLPAFGVAALTTLAVWALAWRPCGGARSAALVTSLSAFSFWAYAAFSICFTLALANLDRLYSWRRIEELQS